jgi:hypothetical protein
LDAYSNFIEKYYKKYFQLEIIKLKPFRFGANIVGFLSLKESIPAYIFVLARCFTASANISAYLFEIKT